jgi:hypothetical protein
VVKCTSLGGIPALSGDRPAVAVIGNSPVIPPIDCVHGILKLVATSFSRIALN